MKIALITPHYSPPTRGNAVTVRRIESHLRAAGVNTAVFPLETARTDHVLVALERFRPDLIHAFHAYHGGEAALAAAGLLKVPYLITLTGTDLYQSCGDRLRITAAALSGAAAVAVFHHKMGVRLREMVPHLSSRLVVIPQGVELPEPAAFPQAEELIPDDSFTFFLPAGLRPVKDVHFPLQPMSEIHRRFPRVRLLIAGPVLDREYASKVQAELALYPFARYAGEVARDRIGALYRRSMVVLNTSRVEGGMANTLLEALSCGKPVLVSAIEGNSSLIRDGENGLCFHNSTDFLRKAKRLITDPDLRNRLSTKALQTAGSFSPDTEACSYLQLYRDLLDDEKLRSNRSHAA